MSDEQVWRVAGLLLPPAPKPPALPARSRQSVNRRVGQLVSRGAAVVAQVPLTVSAAAWVPFI
ncbi:hypothetical protein HCA58_05245 [Micromonospora sp. HNM0581]|uniref:hypothetical protein n=1 Tax=Micromonospora sp. HNM0581 TaxID=2716341 RepID=UPI00146B8363|nr:hypothetical protein [Micromonospora sp. HNM0581]NLU77811.1 hypothetical protein [Micromonospora sp. HNM0581]